MLSRREKMKRKIIIPEMKRKYMKEDGVGELYQVGYLFRFYTLIIKFQHAICVMME